MIFADPDADFTREEAARALAIPLAALDALIQHGLLTTKNTTLPVRGLELFFRDSLLRLYHAQAAPQEVAVEIPSKAEPVEKEEELLRSMDDYHSESAKQPRPNYRIAPRYEPRQPVDGTFRDVRFAVLQISGTGLRIRHEETLRPGDEQRVSIAVTSQRSVVFKARVVWSSIGSSSCVSGLRVTGNGDQLLAAIDALKRGRVLETEGTSTSTSNNTKRTPPALVGVSDDVVASIIRAHRKFSSDPVEAGKWYARVRVSVNDERVRKIAAPLRVRDREEILGIWEYLDRKVDVDAILNVVSWLRQTRSAAAV